MPQRYKHPVATFHRASDTFAPFIELQHSLASQRSAISPSVDQIMQFVKVFLYKLCISDESAVDIEAALKEALANAVIHGNQENPHKNVYVTCRCSMNGEVSIVVRDEGQGFDTRAFLDPVDPSNPSLAHRWGLYLMQAFMDEVRFEENGTVAIMRKALGPRVRKPRTSFCWQLFSRNTNEVALGRCFLLTKTRHSVLAKTIARYRNNGKRLRWLRSHRACDLPFPETHADSSTPGVSLSGK